MYLKMSEGLKAVGVMLLFAAALLVVLWVLGWL
jgi:hypothetical protein